MRCTRASSLLGIRICSTYLCIPQRCDSASSIRQDSGGRASRARWSMAGSRSDVLLRHFHPRRAVSTVVDLLGDRFSAKGISKFEGRPPPVSGSKRR